MMTKKLTFTVPCSENMLPRVGGGALIGNAALWPTAPEGDPLTLVMSIPTEFLNENVGFSLPSNHYISVFSYYSSKNYFLDCITYHGSQDELGWLKKGFTRVILHAHGSEVFSATTLPAMCLQIDSSELDHTAAYGGSKIGGFPSLLQAEPLALGDERFALQLYGGNFPKGQQGIFGLSDGVGYLFIKPSIAITEAQADAGTFFVQVT